MNKSHCRESIRLQGYQWFQNVCYEIKNPLLLKGASTSLRSYWIVMHNWFPLSLPVSLCITDSSTTQWTKTSSVAEHELQVLVDLIVPRCFRHQIQVNGRKIPAIAWFNQFNLFLTRHLWCLRRPDHKMAMDDAFKREKYSPKTWCGSCLHIEDKRKERKKTLEPQIAETLWFYV